MPTITVYVAESEFEKLSKLAALMRLNSEKWTPEDCAVYAIIQGVDACIEHQKKMLAMDEFDLSADASQPAGGACPHCGWRPDPIDSPVTLVSEEGVIAYAWDEDDGGSPMPPPDFGAMSAREVYGFFYRAWRTYRHANPGGEFGFLLSGDERLKALKVASLKSVLMKEHYTPGETVSGYIFPESNLPLWQHALVNAFIWKQHSKPSIKSTEIWKQLEAVSQ